MPRAPAQRRDGQLAGPVWQLIQPFTDHAVRLQPAEFRPALGRRLHGPDRHRGEALGFDYLTMTDHVVLPDTKVPGYPYSESGEFYMRRPSGTSS